MRQIIIFSIGCLLILNSCAPKISTKISKSYPPLDYREEVKMIGLQAPAPQNAQEIGTVKIGDAGMSTNCGWEVVIDKAKLEARKAGGNVIKITKHNPPSIMGSSCHRITATIYKVENFDSIPIIANEDSTLINADYALLHVYRYGGVGSLINYDLHLGDTVICRVSSKWKKTIKIRKDGLNTLWAKTESKEELPINIKFGKEYYVRCSVTMGILTGRPKLELIENETGKAEYQSIKLKKKDLMDLIILNTGEQIECVINNEDNDNLYFTILKEKKEVEIKMSKSQIKSIQRDE